MAHSTAPVSPFPRSLREGPQVPKHPAGDGILEELLLGHEEELLVQAVGDYHRVGHAAVVGDQDIPSPLGDVLSSLVLNPVGHWGPQTGEKTAEGIKTHDSRSFTI